MPSRFDLLIQGLESLGLDSSGGRMERLERYIREIELWNPAYSLVKAEGNELVVKHILDSLAALPLIQELRLPVGRVADLGTGAGLPGIPLALFLPDSRVTLVERMEKRVLFLENQKALLGLSNVDISPTEAERTPGTFDLVVFRAFRPFSEAKLFRTILRLVAPGGAILAYKGRLDHTRQELTALALDPKLGPLAGRATVSALRVPFMEEERCAVVLRP